MFEAQTVVYKFTNEKRMDILRKFLYPHSSTTSFKIYYPTANLSLIQKIGNLLQMQIWWKRDWKVWKNHDKNNLLFCQDLFLLLMNPLKIGKQNKSSSPTGLLVDVHKIGFVLGYHNTKKKWNLPTQITQKKDSKKSDRGHIRNKRRSSTERPLHPSQTCGFRFSVFANDFCFFLHILSDCQHTYHLRHLHSAKRVVKFRQVEDDGAVVFVKI